jgi:polysaccharide export outer membrane protein
VKFSVRRCFRYLQIVLALPASVAAGQNSSAPNPATLPINLMSAASVASPVLLKRDVGYQLRKGDSLELVFALCPEFNQSVTVQPDGYISLKGVGDVTAFGLSLADLAKSIDTAYKAILNNPQVVVSLKEKDIEKPYFIAAGQVMRPGKYDLRSTTTVFQAVTIAGGFTDNAKHSQVVLYRQTLADGYEARVVNIKKLLAEHNLNQDIRLEPGDMLYVPKSGLGIIKPYLPGTNVFLNPLTY